MGYPEDALAGDEELILHRHPHWKMLLVPAITFVLATALAGFGLGLADGGLDGSGHTAAVAAIAAVWLAVVCWRTVPPLLRWKFTHFIVTDRRVLIREGVLTHSGIDIPVARISNVQFRHGPIDRILRTGTLVIVAASDDPLEFDDIPEVQRVHGLLYHQVFDATDVRGERRGDTW
ncbi:PH domain-containing protein [Rhodococcus triatomae]|uniref:Membrane protein YdbS, contains bPH2 (Pleckstrin homology) domain n=1 Tax=Rhodococcus triatomae TaxID=300028 RepID=A0A1G8FDQ6_9NOCA|nr:PH domain-containing protein [Rhodococcus triatomae]QNG19459.1 PH domain-containing protein [Rhodococcus triatomae]QNG24627.1 PH domain-containing protein [Rhodococcus triatomae]SDH80291.1 membrane protein YdbS, contains bPH2 (pleckstrin homology) domain [Rhodococcus triatomae]